MWVTVLLYTNYDKMEELFHLLYVLLPSSAGPNEIVFISVAPPVIFVPLSLAQTQFYTNPHFLCWHYDPTSTFNRSCVLASLPIVTQ